MMPVHYKPHLHLFLLFILLFIFSHNLISMDSKETFSLKVVMVPWLAHGHISPYLELAKKLSHRNFSIYFCSTLINLISVLPKLSDNSIHLVNNYPSIHLVELHLPSLPELPPHYHTTNGLPPHLMPILVQAFQMNGPDCITTILETIKPDLIIYDIMQPWLPSIASELCIPAVHFETSGVASVSFVYQICRHPEVTNYPFPPIVVRESEMKKMAACPAAPSPPASGYSEKDLIYNSLDGSHDIILVKCFKEMVGENMDFLSDLSKKKVVSVGPLIVEDSNNNNNEHSEILEWLSEKKESSTVFVSFGSEIFLSKKEIEELVHGLEGSNVNFIWVIRVPPPSPREKNLNKNEEILSEGFLERVKERGKIVEWWAPQARILKHPSIGGFVSHCGWSSIMESLSFGVPIIAMPIQYDQPLNARLVVEIGVGKEVLRDESGEFKGEEVAKVIREVVVEEGGEDVRRKAKEVGEKMRMEGDEDIDSLVEELQKLCHKYDNQG